MTDFGLENSSLSATKQVLAAGTEPGLWNSFFNTGPTGAATLVFPTSQLPPGVLTSLQAAVYNQQTVIAFTNAVQITVE